MWELIEENRRKSIAIFLVMGIILLGLGGSIGGYLYAQNPRDGILSGCFVSLVIWLIWGIIAYYSGDSIMLRVCHAKEAQACNYQQLINIVEEMKIASLLPVMPKIYIIPSYSMNAFATGRDPEHSSIAVTAGLLSRLNRDELQGVIAHEMSHILNRDILFMTFAGIMAGAITMISEAFLRGLFHSSRHRNSSKKGGGNIIFLLIALILALVGPIIARILYFSISRKREFLADATAARLTRFPEGLASALEKISKGTIDPFIQNRATAPLYISNPFGDVYASSFESTHPPIHDRIRILRALGGNVAAAEYQKAYYHTLNKTPGFPESFSRSDSGNVAIRTASSEENVHNSLKKTEDIIRAVNNFLFISCSCGLRIKIPPEFKKNNIKCPRCGNEHAISHEGMAALTAMTSTLHLKKGEKHQVFQRRSDHWESVICEKCSRAIQLSPLFKFSEVTCKGCGSVIEIKNIS